MGEGTEPIVKGSSISDGKRSMVVHHQKCWEALEVNTQCDAIPFA